MVSWADAAQTSANCDTCISGLLDINTVPKIWTHLEDDLQANLLGLMRKVALT